MTPIDQKSASINPIKNAVPTLSNMKPPSGKDIISVIIRYSIICVLLIITFLYIYNPTIQFIMFIVLLIVIVFGATFIVRDITITQRIWSETSPFMNIYSSNTAFSFLFLFAISVGLILKIVSITLIIVVLNYGRRQLSNSNSSLTSELNTDNTITINKYMRFFISSTILLALLTAMVFILYATPPVRVAIANISAIVLSLGVIVANIYEIVYASSFFDIFKRKGLVYQQNNKQNNKNQEEVLL